MGDTEWDKACDEWEKAEWENAEWENMYVLLGG